MDPRSAGLALGNLLAELLDMPTERIPNDRNLIELGVDSIAMMRIAGMLRRQGVVVGFAELAAAPTFAAWRALVGETSESITQSTTSTAAFDESAPFAMAPMQRAYWLGRDEGQRLGGVAAHFYNEFDGQDIDPVRLESAVHRLLDRHAMLRAHVVDDAHMQILERSPWPRLVVHDLRDLAPDDARRELDELRTQLSHRQLDVVAGEVFDVRLSLLPDAIRPRGARLHVNLDMIAADALSLRLLLGDLASLYAAEALLPIGYSYARYLADRAKHTADKAGKRDADEAYWQARLPAMPSAPQLPAASMDTRLDATRVVRRHRWLAPERMRVFEHAAREHGLTPAMALAAVFAETLTAWSTDPAFLLNLPVFDREPLHPDTALLVGDFTSSNLLAWDGETPGAFATRAQALQHRFHDDMRHAGRSGLDVLRDLSRLRGEQVIAPVVYTSAIGLGELFPNHVRQAFGDPAWIISQGPQVWLDAQVTELDGGLLVNIDAREDAFAEGVLDAMFDAHGALLDRLIDEPAAWTTPVPAMLSATVKATRERANNTALALPRQRLHDGFFDHALRAPDAPALLWGDNGRMSYGELRDAALRLAGWLRAQDIGPGHVVAAQLPKGPDQAIAVLGILAAGATYLPIGIDQPDLRRQRICDAAGVSLLLREWPKDATPLDAPVPGNDTSLAYVLYTSGSTGEPKGVEIPHVAAMNTILDLERRLALEAHDRTLAISALEFDLSVYDLFAPWHVGGAVVCIDEGIRRDAAAWVALMHRHAVTILNCVPALLDMMLTAATTGEAGPPLRAVLLGGDWVTLDLPPRLRRWVPRCRCIALGGTTETAIHSTFREVVDVESHWRSVPYGLPLANVKLRVVDASGRDCPDMVEGELWIGGTGVARGYRGDPVRSAAKFVEYEGLRWYRTGDRARYWPDGEVEFLGRADFQVKLRGHRIELGEIEAAVSAWPGVVQAVAVAGTHGLGVFAIPATPIDGPRIVDLRQASDDHRDLVDFLAARLPSAMIPETLCWRDALPLTANGKIDRPALGRELEASRSVAADAGDAPVNDIERRVAEVWSQVLGVPDIGRDRNFFSLGGDSLSATRLIPSLREAGLAGATLGDLFAAPRLRDFAARLRLGDVEHDMRPLILDPANRHAPFAPTEVQRAYWIGRDPAFVLGGVGCHFYREYDVRDLDIARLQAALNTLVARHDMLRAVFDEHGDQRVLDEVPTYVIEVVDAGSDAAARFAQLRESAAHRVFDPTRWPLFHVAAVSDGRDTRLAVGLDNLVLDALSILRFYTEWGELYAGHDNAPAPALTFRDYLANATPSDDILRTARCYWDDRLPALPPAPQLPLACDPAQLGTPRFLRQQGHVDATRWRHILQQASTHGLTASAVLLTAFTETLARWSARPELTLNLTLFDRQPIHPDVHRVMGDFTSLTLLGYQPRPADDWIARARHVQHELGQALEHRAISSVTLVRDLARLHDRPELSMPVVFTSALGVPGGTAAAGQGPFQRQVWGLTQTPQVWLDHQVVEAEGGIALNWDHVEGLFPPGMVEAMFAAYLRMLDWLGASDWSGAPPDLLPVEQAVMRRRVNATDAPHPDEGLHDAFFRIARDEPSRAALRWGDDRQVDYGTLADQALRIARSLERQGVVPGDLVAISLPKGAAQIAAVLGVLAAGAAYLPIGVDQPPARRERILRRAGAQYILGAGGMSIDAALIHEPLASPRRTHGDALAYVIYTSGSTGEPKGVEIAHAAALNTLVDVTRRFGIDGNDRVLAVSALDFDLSVFDIFAPLAVGGSLVLVDEDDRRDAACWRRLVRNHGVTVWNSVPALLDMALTNHAESDELATLRLALLSGDWIALDLPRRLVAQAPRCRFVSLGGATEASVWSNVHEVVALDPDWRSIPYGVPLANQRFRVVDARERDCPDWVPGELWIGGAGVALGYRHAPEVTARQFSVRDGMRWYRTGDLGRYRPDGLLEFLGRQDHQVKLRGHRIELGEIESALLALPDIAQAVAMVLTTATGRHLAAAVVTHNDVDETRWREALAASLPAHMLPERIVPFDALPLTANGKLDRRAIAERLTETRTEETVDDAPLDDTERAIATHWQALFGTAAIDREASFFALGGDSLLATRFIERLRTEDGVTLPLRRLFAAPTLRDVAAMVRELQRADATLEEGAL
ncbi:MAG: Phenyloxazoline synthase MbtB [Luteibacter sp.]|uniref:non-ribosomal peptide synthetase n=1 Tax=Luteibacter sp. TaxID=1886636 RepID=UPI00137E649A|nr:non-ribosomal peptide synthetase [Luteibacter sp.]KAF1007467.1 MAG: Phenyloxazoline synthase MbtB [Luteibacter sp.]